MIVILTALDVEYEAVLAHLVDVTPHKHSHGTIFDVGRLASHPERRVALGLAGQGAAGAAALTERAHAQFSPSAMLFVGIAGSLRDWLEIGDVVVATTILAYQGGKAEGEEFLARPESWTISHSLDQVARRLRRDSALRAELTAVKVGTEPDIYFEAVAVGNVVLNSRVASLARQLRGNYNQAVAIEMESSGFALAAHRLTNVPNAAIRGISDHADGSKSATDGRGGQAVAARNAAAFAVALAAAADDHGDSEGLGAVPGDPRPPSAPGTVNNSSTVSGSGRVGQNVTGNGNTISSSRTGGWR